MSLLNQHRSLVKQGQRRLFDFVSYRIQKDSHSSQKDPEAWLRRARRNLNPGAHPTPPLPTVGETGISANKAYPFQGVVSPSATRITSVRLVRCLGEPTNRIWYHMLFRRTLHPQSKDCELPRAYRGSHPDVIEMKWYHCLKARHKPLRYACFSRIFTMQGSVLRGDHSCA